MRRTNKLLMIVSVMLAALVVLVVPTFAQSSDSGDIFPTNTITVTGYGLVQAAPDVATVEVGVESFNSDITVAFTEANSTLEGIVTALTGLGIAPENIRTSNLNVYNSSQYNPETGAEQRGYYVSNTVLVVVSDVSQITEVIDTAINAGANSLHGLSFSIKDKSTLEKDARAAALEDAAARAGHYAELIGATLGDVVVVSESQGFTAYPTARFAMAEDSGRGGAFVAPGQSEVQVQVQVTYKIVR